MLTFIAAFSISCILSYILTPAVAAFARRADLLDYPDERKVHSIPTPRLGGLAIYIACAGTVALLYTLLPHGREASGRDFTGAAIASSIIFCLGIYDDVWGASAPVKFSVQIAASLVLVGYGFLIRSVPVPFAGHIAFGPFAFPLTILWLVGICNAINLMDGLDGLAGGVVLIASLSFFSIGWHRGYPTVAFLAIIVAGSVAGFLRHNFPPARTFMGDTGSLFLGFALGTIALWSGSGNFFSVFGLSPAIVLGIPILDTMMAIYRRASNHMPIFRSDTQHLHHRLVGIGCSHRKAVSLLCLLSAQMGVLSFVYAIVRMGELTLGVLGFAGVTLFCIVRALKSAEQRYGLGSMRSSEGRVQKAKEDVRAISG